MKITPAQNIDRPEVLHHILKTAFPEHTLEIFDNRWVKAVMVGKGMMTGVQAAIKEGEISIGWQIPNKVIRTLLPLSFVLTGILPGVLIFLIAWLVIRNDVAELREAVAQALTRPMGDATVVSPGGFSGGGVQGAVGPATPAVGGFGAPAQGAGGFGAPAQGAGGFGAPAQAPAAGGFGAPAQAPAAGGFGAPAQAPAAGGFAPPPAAPPAEPAPGCAITVAGPDGTPYPAKFVRKQDGHVLCAFQNGQEQWYEERLVTFG